MAVPGRWVAWTALASLLAVSGAAAGLSLATAPSSSTPPPVVTYGEGPEGGVAFVPPATCQPEVPAGTYSRSELTALKDGLAAELSKRRFVGIGLGLSTVDVELQPGKESLAARIERRFGREVSVTVGLTIYCGRPGRSPVCAALPRATPVPPGLSLDLTVAHATVRSGASGSGTLVVADDGPGTFNVFPGQPLVAEVVARGTHRVVATNSLALAGTGYGSRLTPGRSVAFPVAFGTARCDGGPGSALPAGRYGLVVSISPETSGGRAPSSAVYAATVPLLVER